LTSRERGLAEQMIERFELDLGGLRVLTEAASGPYLHTPLLAAIAGAERVLAVTADSPYAAKEEVAERTAREAESWGVADRVEIGFERSAEWLGSSDIVTNTGFVRPLDADLVARLKPTAVIPLMWETWEFRPGEVDLEACRARGILVLGTDESQPPCDMRPYIGELGLRLLGELGLEAGSLRIALLGGQPLIGGAIHATLRDRGNEVLWFASDAAEGNPYEELREKLMASAGELDAVLVAEHHDHRLLLGPRGELDPAELAQANPDLPIGVIAGNVDADSLRRAGLRFVPERIRPFAEMSFQPAGLGPEPVLMLYAAGLRVGEAMARARLRGDSPEEAAREALRSSPAMDFPGELSWA
jgi:hypothetical protein